MAPWDRGAALEVVVRIWVFLEGEPTGFAIQLDLGYERKESHE